VCVSFTYTYKAYWHTRNVSGIHEMFLVHTKCVYFMHTCTYKACWHTNSKAHTRTPTCTLSLSLPPSFPPSLSLSLALSLSLSLTHTHIRTHTKHTHTADIHTYRAKGNQVSKSLIFFPQVSKSLIFFPQKSLNEPAPCSHALRPHT